MEAQFALSNIKTDETKFYYITGILDPQYTAVVEDIISYPPDSGKYEKLKADLIKRLSASRERKVKQLLMHEELETGSLPNFTAISSTSLVQAYRKSSCGPYGRAAYPQVRRLL